MSRTTSKLFRMRQASWGTTTAVHECLLSRKLDGISGSLSNIHRNPRRIFFIGEPVAGNEEGASR
ncbi:hypothetical protein [Burkholderia sp. PU8-34]